MIQEKVLDHGRQLTKLDDQVTALYNSMQTLRENQELAKDTIKDLCARVSVLEVSAKADIVTTGREAED